MISYLLVLAVLGATATVVVVSCCVVSSRISQGKRAAGTKPIPAAQPAMLRRMA